jgi:UDP-N-acetyl-D-galactosamine dehydrogenase
LKAYHIEPVIYDPWANPADVKEIYDDITICNELPQGLFNVVILAVAHKVFLDLDINILKDTPGIVFDVKSILPKNIIDGRL